MLAESNIGMIVLSAKDIRQTRNFYENVLGFVPVRAFGNSVTYAAGAINLTINEVKGFGSHRDPGGDDSELLVFHVDSVDDMRAALEKRGVSFTPTLRYEIGATTSFHDPDLHNITLYEPSEESLTWPSGPKVKQLIAEPRPPRGELLGTRKFLYLFLFVRDTAEALKFYRDTLGLKVIEDDPDAGVVKYDVGGLVIATHLVGGDSMCAVDMDLSYEKGVAPAFSVIGLDDIVKKLEARDVTFLGTPAVTSNGAVAKFRDPSGHMFYLCEGVDAPLPEVPVPQFA